jgi:hypothetical protein
MGSRSGGDSAPRAVQTSPRAFLMWGVCGVRCSHLLPVGLENKLLLSELSICLLSFDVLYLTLESFLVLNLQFQYPVLLVVQSIKNHVTIRGSRSWDASARQGHRTYRYVFVPKMHHLLYGKKRIDYGSRCNTCLSF